MKDFIPMNKLIQYTLYFLFLLVLGFTACTKEEFMPPPIGEQLRDEEPTETYLEKLEDGPYTIFLAAWERSHMEEIFAARGEKAPFTLLVPTNEAFETAGLGLQEIQAMEINDLDSLLSYHVLGSHITPATLRESSGSKPLNTLLTHATLYLSGNDRYVYRHYVDFKGDELSLNGKSMGAIKHTNVKNGVLWPVNSVILRPKLMLDVLKDDGRFSIFLEVCRLNDSTYRAKFNNPSQFRPSLEMMRTTPGLFDRPVIYPSSLLAPTDEAFLQAGFNTAKDFTALNIRTSATGFSVRNVIASDSILVNHFFGAKTYALSVTSGGRNPLVFYSNDMNNDWLGGYHVFYEGIGTGGTVLPPVIMPLDFIQNDGSQLRIRVKNSSHEPGTVLESDINTLNGPIHVIDRLLIPERFRLTP